MQSYDDGVTLGGSATLRVIVSYRREDSISITGRIRDRLASQFGADNVYFDIDSIPAATMADSLLGECLTTSPRSGVR